MSINLRRTVAALVLPAALLLTVTACGDDDTKKSSDDTSSTAPADETSAADDQTSPADEETDAAEPPAAGDIPDPSDKEGMRAYLKKNFLAAGMPEDQAQCNADAIVDNADLEKYTSSDPEEAAAASSDPKVTAAMQKCITG